jgi:phosphatidylserine/phosphatidylglycerophosphate/cardiolipin synthase-like enzyme
MSRKLRPRLRPRLVFALLSALLVPTLAQAQAVVINEVAWMGTTASTSDEWIELHNPTGAAVDLTGWTLAATDGTPSITLSGTVAAHGYFLLERTDDSTVPGVAADQIYSGALGNGGEVLELRDSGSNLVDSVDAWYAGDNTAKAAMSRISALDPGTSSTNWETAAIGYSGGYGTPGAANGDLVINEIAWMGTTASTSDEWIELYNPTGAPVDVSGWTLAATDGTPSITLSGTVPALGHFLLERTDDSTVPGVAADQIYTGALDNGGEVLELRDGGGTLIDLVDAWYAGDNTAKATMERVDPASLGTEAASWATATAAYSVGYGTPASSAGGGPAYTSDWYQVYFSDHLGTVLPGATGPSATGQALIDAIDAAADSIDFALYGVGGAQGVIDALVAAVGRGVTVRGVVDSDSSGYFPYADTQTLIDALPPGSVVVETDDALMHNKFFVFDDRYVWTGSANVSDTGLYIEYNGNWSILIDHPDLAAAYEAEFAEMYAGSFHTDKTDNTQHTFPPLADGSVIESYFAPTDDAETHAILRAIDEATSTLDLRIFSFTDWDIRDAVIAAHDRGVAVRAIVDASQAEGEFSVHQELRDAGIPVKVENWPGKEHTKGLAADGEVVIIGSQNWTYSGNTANDENTLYIRNAPLAEAFTADFELKWASIPSAWLTADPGPESADSPGSTSDFLDNDHDGLTDEGAPEALNTVSTALGAINVYFDKSALTSTNQGTLANHNVNLEDRIVARIEAATTTIDVATYELNLPGIVDALLERADAGVSVRLIADAKDYAEGESSNYDLFVLTLERLARGLDGTPGTADDVVVFADSPVLAVLDTAQRAAQGLPSVPSDFPYQTLTIGSGPETGYVVALGEKKNATDYYAPGPQMHNKFMVFDGTWVWTGSWNFTMNGLYGDDANRPLGILGGNSNNALEIHSPDLADIYTDEFEEMWGGTGAAPDPDAAKFHGRKSDNTAHVVTVGGSTVEVYFSPGDDALGKVTQTVIDEADVSADFCAFTWSDQAILDELKLKWENSKVDLVGTLTGFSVEGVFDSLGFNQWWSASVDMTGRTASNSSQDNPNTRWANPAPVYKDREDAILHHKYMVLDGHTASDPIVITGSTNWSANGNDTNDENLLIIHDAAVADQYMQEFAARYYQAGGELP